MFLVLFERQRKDDGISPSHYSGVLYSTVALLLYCRVTLLPAATTPGSTVLASDCTGTPVFPPFQLPLAVVLFFTSVFFVPAHQPALMSRLLDTVLSARRRALPVLLSVESNSQATVFPLTGMPTGFVLEPRATTLLLSAFFDAGVQSSAPWLSVAAMFGASPSEPVAPECNSNDDTESVAHPKLNAALMRIVCPSTVLRSKPRCF